MYDLNILCRHETPIPILLLGYPNLRQKSLNLSRLHIPSNSSNIKERLT